MGLACFFGATTQASPPFLEHGGMMATFNLVQCDGCGTESRDGFPPDWRAFRGVFGLAGVLDDSESSCLKKFEGDFCPGCQAKLITALETLTTPAPAAGQVSIATVERKHILSVLDATRWNKSEAARILDIERSTLDRKLRSYGADRRPSERQSATA